VNMKLMTTTYLLLFMTKGPISSAQDVFWKLRNSGTVRTVLLIAYNCVLLKDLV